MSRRRRELGLLLALAAAAVLVWLLVDPGASAAQENSSPPARAPVNSHVSDAAIADDVHPPRPPSDSSGTTDSTSKDSVASEGGQSVTLRPIVVSGALRDSHGNPLVPNEHGGRTYIGFESAAGGHRRASMLSADEYRIDRLDPGIWTIRVHAPSCWPWSGTFELLPENRERRIDIVLEAYERFHVRTEVRFEEPVTGPSPDHRGTVDATFAPFLIRLVVTQESPPAQLSDVYADDTEEDLIGDLESSSDWSEPGRYIQESEFEIHGRLPVHVSAAIGDRIVRTERVESTSERVQFVFDQREIDDRLGTLRFRLLDAGGRALEQPISCRLWRDRESWDTRLLSSTDGGMIFRRLLPGRLGIEVSAEGCATWRFETLVDPGMDRDLGEIRLAFERTIRGRIFSHDDSVMSFEATKLECIPLPMAEESRLIRREPYSTTGTEGRFTITGLDRGRYVLRTCGFVSFQLASGPIEVSTESGSIEGLEVRVKPTAPVTIRLAGSTLPACLLYVENADHLPVGEFDIGRVGVAEVHLPLGRHSVRAVVAGEEIASADFQAVLPGTRVVLQRR